MTDDFVSSRVHSLIKANFEFHQLRSLYPEKSSSYLYPIMLTQATYQQAGIPFNLLGLSYQKWRSDDLRLLLNNLGITTMEAAQKIDLVHGLHHLIENGLMPDDPDIVARLQQGRSLPMFRALGGRTLEDLLGGELTSARIRNFQRQRRIFTSEDFALPNLNTSSSIPSLGLILRQDDAKADEVEDRNDDEVLKTDCVVCMEPLTAEVQNSSKITRACNHRRDVCDECLRQAITVDLEEKVWDRIGCPSCGTLLAQEDVIRHGEPKAVAKYEERLTLDSLSSDPNFHLCRHPGCTFGQEIAPDTNQQFMTCLQCHQLTCLSCRTVWHAGISCTQNIRNIKGPTAEQQKEEEASEALVAKTSKTCPNATCGARVDKVSGCDHMKCSRCGSQYCWECQADQEKIWSEGNSAHEKGCKHWRPAGDREGSPDVSDTSDDEDIDDAHDTDVEDARPLEPRERQRRGAMGGWHVGRNGAVGEQESQRPVPRTRMTREGVDEAVRVRAAHVARAAETVSPQSAIPESGRMMREQPLEAARMRANDLAWALETARNQASIPASVPTTQDQYQEEALQRIEALARVHQRRVENRAMRFHQAPEATSQYQDTHPSDRNPKTEADQEALQPARRRAPQVFDPVNRYQHNAERQARRTDYDRTQADVDEQQRVEQGLREFMKSSAEQRVQEEFGHNTSDRNTTTEADQEALQPTRRRGQQAANEIQRPPTFAQITDRHRAHADVHELERMSTQQWSELSLPDKTSLVEQRAQDIADQHTSATSPHQGYPQPPEGHPRQRQQEPTQQQTSTPAPAHQEQALVKRQPAMSFSATRQPPSGTTLAPPGFRFPHSPLQTPQLPMWALTPTPQHPKRETPIFPPGLPLFSPPRPAHLPPGPLFSNPFGSPPGPPFSNPFSSNPVPESYPSPTSPPSNPIRPPTPPHPLASASPKPPAPPTGTPESLAPLLRLQQTSDPARQWVWTLQAGHLILSEYPPTALVPPLAGVGRQLRARTVLGNDWATVRRLGATANGSGVERLVVEAWGGPGEEEEVHKWRRIGDNLPSKGRGRGGFYSFLGRERGREKE